MADLVSDVSEDGEISEPREFVVDDDSLNIKPPQNQAGSKHKTGRVRPEHKRRDKHKHRRHESKRQHRERRERRDRQPHEQQTFLEPHDQSRPSRSHERREARRERRAQREPPPPEPRMYREPVEEPPVAVRERHRAERPHAERAPPSEGDLRRERFIQAVRVSEYQKEMSKRELEARRHRREIEKLRQRELREIELKREREYGDDREGGERRKRSRRTVENTSEVMEVDLEPERDAKDGREREPRDARDREPRDERDRDAREGRTRELREDRIREPREDRVRESRDDRVREPREERVREPREERNREPREDRNREEREDRIREPREDRTREPREDRIRERDGREREPREERDRSKQSDQDRSSEDEDDDEEDGAEDDNKESSSSSSEESADEEEEADDDEEEDEEEEEEEEDERQETRELSRSPTPPVTGRRWRQTSQSSAEAGSPGRALSPVPSISPPSLPMAPDSPPPSPVELKAVLPPYLPAVQGCRNVEEFNCLNRIEEGTYGVVYRAVDKKTKEIVALKRLKMENEKEGFPITSLREINTLLKAQHENIVTVREIVVGSNMDKIYIVMDYVEHDLKGLMQTMKAKKQSFTTGEVKCLLLQMLRAVRHLHDNWILHRDLKTSNLLLSHKGILKVGDFGLAREYGSPLKPYTPVVVTLWYRAPELLLGVKEYACPIDMWSVGCIFAELVRMDPMFPGKSEADQINRIFKELGTPNETIWPGYSELPAIKKMTFTEYPYNQLANKLSGAVTEKGVALMNKMLTYDPKRRITAEEALAHSYFDEQPRPIEPGMFPTWPAKSEMGHKKATGASPKPPSGRKNLGDEDVGFQLGAAAGAGGFSLKF